MEEGESVGRGGEEKQSLFGASYVEKSENSLKSSTSEMKGTLDHVVQWLINS